LEVCIALDSEYARKTIVDSHKAKLLQTIDTHITFFRGNGIYFSYLNALKALIDEPETDAPDFMWNDAWQTKSCNTVLGGWAQLRHTWALQAKQNVFYASASIVPPGFVEPDPEFFGRMANLAFKTKRILREAGAFRPNYVQLLMGLARFKQLLDGVENAEQLYQILSSQTPVDFMMRNLLQLNMMTGFAARQEFKEYLKDKLELIDTYEKAIRSERIDKYPKLQNFVQQTDLDLEKLWSSFEKVSRRLEVIAHKQLRGADFNKSENEFIKNYGIRIAGIMMYGGNSYYTPQDDAPRIIDVYYNPQLQGYLHVGIARPRKLYVLYPWQDKKVLCEGAIMPYYEFVSNTRLTDLSWKVKLDSNQRPSIPKWIKPIVSGNILRRPKLKH
jgi:hypothetical protein